MICLYYVCVYTMYALMLTYLSNRKVPACVMDLVRKLEKGDPGKLDSQLTCLPTPSRVC